MIMITDSGCSKRDIKLYMPLRQSFTIVHGETHTITFLYAGAMVEEREGSISSM